MSILCSTHPATLSITTDLDRRPPPALLLILNSDDGRRVCIGTWNKYKYFPDHAAGPSGTISWHNGARSKRKASRFEQYHLGSTASSPPPACSFPLTESSPRHSSNPLTPLLQAPLHFCGFSTVFNALRLCHVHGIYTPWTEAQPHIIGIHTDFKPLTS